MPVTHVANGDGTVTQFGDDGQELVTFSDPDGSFTRDHLEPAAAASSQAAPQGSNAERIFARAKELNPAGNVTTVRPESGTVEPDPAPSDFRSALVPPTTEPTGITPSRLPLAGEQTTGLSDEDLAAHRSNREALTATQTRAAEATNKAEQATLDAREANANAESDRALGQYATQLELHETAKASMLGAEETAKRARATPIDPGQALGGAKFFYAIMAGVGASLSNFGSALLGQQGRADTNVVDDIIADSVKQQVADRALNVEGAQDQVDASRKEELRLSMQANASLEKWFQSKAAVEKNAEVRAAYASHAEERAAAIQRDTVELAEKEYKTTVQSRAAPKPVKGAGPAKTPTEVQAIMSKHNVDQKEMNEYGKQRIKTGADIVLNTVDKSLDVVNKLSQGQDVPGLGTWDKFSTAWLNDPDGAAVQQTLGMTKAQFIKSISGAAVTEPEAKRLEGLVQGPGWRPTQETVKRGLELIKGVAEAQLDGVNSGHSDAADAYGEIHNLRKSRVQLTDEQKANRALQSKPAKAGPVQGTPENVAEFTAPPAPDHSKGSHGGPRTRRENSLLDMLDEDDQN